LNKDTQIWLKLNAYIYGSQAFAKRFEQPSYNLQEKFIPKNLKYEYKSFSLLQLF